LNLTPEKSEKLNIGFNEYLAEIEKSIRKGDGGILNPMRKS